MIAERHWMDMTGHPASMIVITANRKNVLLFETAREQRRRSGRRPSKDQNMPSDVSSERTSERVELTCFLVTVS